jgi:hypothetical protein
VFAEAEIAMGELCEAADSNSITDCGDNDVERLTRQLLELAGGAVYLLTQLRNWQARRHERCEVCGSALLHVVGPKVKALICPDCNSDSSALDDDEACPECGAVETLAPSGRCLSCVAKGLRR